MLLVIIYAVLIFFLALSFLGLIVSSSIAWGLIITGGVPFVSTPRADWLKICEVAKLQKGQIVYDLGCGKANLLTTAAKNFGVKGVGYEISLWPNIWGRYRVWRQHADVEIRAKNFLKADIEKADVVFCYLFPHVMEQLESKFRSELKPGAKVISYTFKMPNIEPAQVVKTEQKYTWWSKKPTYTADIFVYQF